MTSTYIIWKASDDLAFRSRYEELTGEKVQPDPKVSADGTEYMIGSSRITLAALQTLTAEFTIGVDPELFIAAPADGPGE